MNKPIQSIKHLLMCKHWKCVSEHEKGQRDLDYKIMYPNYSLKGSLFYNGLFLAKRLQTAKA